MRALDERPRKSNGKEEVIFSECAEKIVIFRGTNKVIEANLDKTAAKQIDDMIRIKKQILIKILETLSIALQHFPNKTKEFQ